MNIDWLNEIMWNEQGLVPAIAQEASSGRVLMVAWMNRKSLEQTINTGKATYWSRTRQKLWRKGEESGNEQIVQEVRMDCDNDVILLQVKQKGGIACHTGRHSCFFQRLEGESWETVDPQLKDPKSIYKL